MNASERRQAVLRALGEAEGPVSATALAGRFKVSRQIIVGDVALLRASGADVIATPRGYVLGSGSTAFLYTVACQHSAEDMEAELNLMVDNGCTVVDVVVEHSLYGQLTGPLHLSSRYDVEEFVRKVEESDARPLSALTGGVHLHTLRCPRPEAYQRVLERLDEAGFLFK